MLEFVAALALAAELAIVVVMVLVEGLVYFTELAIAVRLVIVTMKILTDSLGSTPEIVLVF